MALNVKPGVTAAVPISMKLAGVLTPITLANTVNEPALVGSAVTCARPLPLVLAVDPEGEADTCSGKRHSCIRHQIAIRILHHHY